MLVDSHCHLNYLNDADACLASAREIGVGRFLCISVDEAHFSEVQALAERHEDVWATAGVHPDSVSDGANLDWIEDTLSSNRIVGVGETGLDYSRLDTKDQSSRSIQRLSFTHQLKLAAKYKLPVVVHTRDAAVDTLACMRAAADTIGVMHCFTESWQLAEAALELGYYISISGIVTFKNAATVREVAKKIPADRLLIETDCPWLAPVPHRGHTNEPAFVKDTARFLAELRCVTLAQLTDQTTENFLRLFSRVGAHSEEV